LNITKSKTMKIAVIALLKPSQVTYKITPLLRSDMVSLVVLFRKNKYEVSHEKLVQFVLPKFTKFKPLYWTLTPFYVAYQLRKLDIDLLITYRFMPHTIYTFVVSKLLRKPFIYSQIDMDVVTLFENSLGKKLILTILRRAIQINVPGLQSSRFWGKYLSQPINILHSTIDIDMFKPTDAEVKYDLMCVGVLTKLKRVSLIIDTIYLLHKMGVKVTLAVVGEGNQRSHLENQIETLGLSQHVYLLGHQIVTPTLLCSARVFTMASNSEGLPCALMEAMACERLCIVTDVGNIPDIIVPSQTGFLYQTIKPSLMASQIAELLDKYNDYGLVRKNARHMIVKNHSFESATKKWDKIFKEVKFEK